MKKTMLLVSAFFITGALLTPVFAQEAPPAQAPAAAEVKPAAPAKKTVKKKAVKKAAKNAPAKQLAAEAAPISASQVQVSTAAPAPVPAEVQQVPQVAAATAAVVSAPVKDEPALRSACPNCFQPLLGGYEGIISDLRPWMDEMDVKAGILDRRLSAIQKQINEKEDAIEKAKLGADKKEAKAAVKVLNKERKAFLTQYSDATDRKEAFYKKFSKEIEKKVEGYNKTVDLKLRMTLSAASQ